VFVHIHWTPEAGDQELKTVRRVLELPRYDNRLSRHLKIGPNKNEGGGFLRASAIFILHIPWGFQECLWAHKKGKRLFCL
jgi:hypothetical protein